jgi:parvulin-like peptidyl-prolyl isomerase
MVMSKSATACALLVVGVAIVLGRPGSATARQAPPPAGQAVRPPATQGIAATPASAGLSRSTVIEQIIVKVNGDILTKTELEARQADMLRQRGMQPTSQEEVERLVTSMMPELLVDTVDEMLLVQRGRELGYRLTDERFKQILEGIRKQNNLESDEAFQAALRSENLTLADLRRRFEINLIRNQVEQQEVLARISITEEEARAYYAEHAQEFTTPAAITLREVLVSVPSDGKTINVGLEEEAKAKADAARAKALSGTPFETVVAEVSDASSKANGGLIGPLNPADLAPAIQGIISRMKQGDVSEVLRTPRGFYFFKLDSSAEATVLPFEQARDQIGNRIGDLKRDAEFEKYMRRLRDNALIEWKSPELKKLHDAHLAAPAGAKGGV